jgi:predicted ATPase
LIAAEAAAAKHARQLAAELDAVTSELMRVDADTRAKHHADSARAIVNAGRKARNEPLLDENNNIVSFPKDRST